MTRILRDSVDPFAIPVDTEMVGGYVDGIFGPNHAAYGEPGWDTSGWSRFPNSIHIRIAVKPTTNDGNCGDVETGDMTPAQAPGWVLMRRQAGVWASIYCNLSTWPEVRQAFKDAGVSEPPYWIAYYNANTSQEIPNDAVAHQWANSTIIGHNYDQSIVADNWPGVDEGMYSPEDLARGIALSMYEVMGRDPEPGALEGHKNVALKSGIESMVNGIATAPEFTAHRDALDKLLVSGPSVGSAYDDTIVKRDIAALQNTVAKVKVALN